jgi:hypothetical protein
MNHGIQAKGNGMGFRIRAVLVAAAGSLGLFLSAGNAAADGVVDTDGTQGQFDSDGTHGQFTDSVHGQIDDGIQGKLGGLSYITSTIPPLLYTFGSTYPEGSSYPGADGGGGSSYPGAAGGGGSSYPGADGGAASSYPGAAGGGPSTARP